jgi:hypothetical protein
MRYNLFLPVVLAGSLFLASACGEQKPVEQPDKTSGEEKIINFLQSRFKWEQIDSCYARKLFDNFNSLYRPKLMEAFPNGGIPSNIWFDSTFILYLAKRIVDSNYSGIRIYFGAYDPAVADGRLGTAFEKAPTVFVLETKRGGTDNRRHIDQFGQGCMSPFRFQDAYNHGHLCPPDSVCDGSYFKPPQ